MKTYDVYIFDLDGTITNTTAIWIEIFRDSLLHFKVAPPEDNIIAQHTHEVNDVVKFGLPEKDLPAFIKYMSTLANQRLSKSPLHIGAYEMLEKLKNEGKKIAFYSTMGRVNFNPVMQHRNLYSLADAAVAGDDILHRKPHPDGILKALKDMGIEQKDFKKAVYIGDKDTDIVAAHNAGIDSILYYPIDHQLLYDLFELKQHNPTRIITDWKELF